VHSLSQIITTNNSPDALPVTQPTVSKHLFIYSIQLISGHGVLVVLLCCVHCPWLPLCVNYSRQGGYVFAFFCLSVSWITQKVFDEFWWIFFVRVGFVTGNKQLKGSVKEPNISIYFFFCLSLNGVLFPMFCLLVEGKCRILVF